MAAIDVARAVPSEVLGAWLVRQRWFASKSRDISEINVLEAVPLREEAPIVGIVLLEVRFGSGTHELYQLLVGLRPEDEVPEDCVIHVHDGWAVHDAFIEPQEMHALAGLMARDAQIAGVRFFWMEGVEPPGPEAPVRAMGAEQSNTSMVFDERIAVKVFRRLEPGLNPELEMLRFLTVHGFTHIAALTGWYEWNAEHLQATLGVAQEYVPDARDGWELTLDALVAHDDGLFALLEDLGEVTGRMHTVLASDSADPAFAPEEPGDESLSLVTATIDEEIERVFLDLDEGDPRVAPIAGRGEEVRDRLKLLSSIGVGGRLIRTHGDYHLGQTLLSESNGWVILDFEGEPARPLPERRRKRSPLRDAAGMLRSFAYAASAGELLRGTPAPEGWEDRAREAFRSGYMRRVDPSLLPPGQGSVDKLLAVFELEKAVYELRYELNNRPDWVGVPVAGIVRLLEEPL